MLTYNELRITPDSKYLIVDVSVDTSDYYDNVVIDNIVIDTLDTFVMNGPSSNPVYTHSASTGYDNVYSLPEGCNCNPVKDDTYAYCFVDGTNNVKHIRLQLSAKELGCSLYENMFFVYAIASGYPSPETPCGMDNSVTMGTVINLYPYYQDAVSYLKEVNSSCGVPKAFIDNFLRFKALELSVKTGNYPLAIKYWNKFFSGKKVVIPNNTCGCNG